MADGVVSRARRREKLLALPGVQSVRRPADAGRPAFDLVYVRTGGARRGPPVVVVPGGPGLASVVPYARLRARAEALGADVLMVEHRGVGMSRTDVDGLDLPASALTVTDVVEDVVAVLDAEGIESAVVYGSSYGSYVAQAVGARHPDRVAGLVLDSAMLSADDRDEVRRTTRQTLWWGHVEETRRVAAKLRTLVRDGVVTTAEVSLVAQLVYEFSGPTTLEALLDQVHAGRGLRTWRRLAKLASREIETVTPFVMELDLVGVIAMRELAFGLMPDGLPFDPGEGFADLAARFPPFVSETLDLDAALPSAPWPVVVLSGERDLRTPRVVAERIVDRAPHGVLVPLPGVGHSVLDTRPAAFLRVVEALSEGGIDAVAWSRAAITAAAADVPVMSLDRIVRTLMLVDRVLPAVRVLPGR